MTSPGDTCAGVLLDVLIGGAATGSQLGSWGKPTDMTEGALGTSARDQIAVALAARCRTGSRCRHSRALGRHWAAEAPPNLVTLWFEEYRAAQAMAAELWARLTHDFPGAAAKLDERGASRPAS